MDLAEAPDEPAPDDETDLLLATFLDIASAERTALTRTRYATALVPLRARGDEPPDCGPGVRLLLRVAEEAGAGLVGVDEDLRASAASLWQRLVRWLVRTGDAGDPGAADHVKAANAALRRSRARPNPIRTGWPDPLAPADSGAWGAPW